MFHPVAPEMFWESPAGKEYTNRFLDRDIARNSNTPLEDLQAGIARWQTANYDPATGRCMLYRGVGPQRLAVAQRSGAMTSRCVEIFGDYDMPAAIASLRQTALGVAPEHVLATLSQRIEESEAQLATIEQWKQYPSHLGDEERQAWLAADRQRGRKMIDGVIALTEGRVSQADAARLCRAAERLSIATQLGKNAYLLAAQEASTDVTPNKSGFISLGDLVHTSIHLSASLTKAWRFGARKPDSGVIRVEFEPGSIPVAPERGYLQGRYQTDGYGYGREEEWYGVGQISSGSNALVAVESMPAIS